MNWWQWSGMRGTKLWLAALAGWLLGLVTAVAADRLIILQTTDIHAHDDAWPRLATLIRQEREAAGADNVLLIDCGDTCQGTLTGSATQGMADIAALNHLAYDVWAPGNHEFDFGGRHFRALATSCQAAVLAANLAGEPPPAKVTSWRMFERAGRRIAVVGMTSPHLAHWFMPAEMDGLQATPMAPALAKVIPVIMAAQPDLIVLAMHHGRFSPERLGGESPYNMIRDYPQIGLVLGGHSHQVEPGQKLGRYAWFVQPGQHGEYLARIEVTWPDRGAPPLISSRLLPTAATPPDAELADKLRSSHPEAAVNPAPLARLPRDMITTMGFTIHAGRALCRAAATEGALIQAVGGDFLPTEDFDETALFRIMPYENQLWRIEVTPAELAEIVAEQQRQEIRRHLLIAVSGRVGSLPEVADPNRRRTLTVSNHALAGGGGRFPVLRRLGTDPACAARPVGICVRDAMRDYFQKRFPVPVAAE